MFDSATEELRQKIFPQEQRVTSGWLRIGVAVTCITLTLITLYFAFTITIGEVKTRGLHLMFTLPLTMLLYPALKSSSRARPSLVDWGLAISSAAAFAWAFYRADAWLDRYVGYDPVPWSDFIFGCIALVTIFEATRRTVGPTIVFLNLLFIGYALTGPYWPGVLEHGGMSIPDFIETMYMDAEGIFNFITGLMATYIFTFLLFGVFLRVSGGDRVFTDLAAAVAGHRRGGPAKVAVVSSALMGMLSGSSISNVSTTGTMTIPMMKRLGFRNYEAAAIEVVSSVGGGLMPPLMGTGIFIMASLTNIPLVEILFYSIAPALLYYVAVYFYADIKAAERGMVGLPRDELPRLSEVVLQGGHIFLPVIILIVLMVLQYTPFFASAACVVMTLAISYLRQNTRMHWKQLLTALEAGTRVAITISALLASAAIIYAVTVHTGLLTKITSILIDYSGGSAVIAIILLGLMSYVIGMGLPVTASYVIIAALGAGALQELGLSVLAAHLVIFWFAQDSTITPPICMTAFVGARIAEAPPMRTGWECVKMAKALYIIPFMFAFSSLLDPSLGEVCFDFAVGLLLFVLVPISIYGYWRQPLSTPVRLSVGLCAALSFTATLGDAQDGLPWLGASIALLACTALVVRRRSPGAQTS
ncbi:TRAP transporter fused permease subunit [Pelagibius sp. CAU 1746]|uniref:TRAP transporter permease n=1 Tax=Pelagibius sp. CAU 1746 TaxID=3140370 RepID=UPI00325BCEBD